MRWLAVVTTAFALATPFSSVAAGPASNPGAGAFVGGATCAGCHQDEARAFAGSHHDLAMQVADADSVLGDFDDATFDGHGVTSRFSRDADGYHVQTSAADGTLQRFRVAYTFGVYPLQQYLVAFDDGRVQALPLAWDSRPREEGGQRWFHLYPNEPIDADHPLHWTGPMQNWNFVCADCHSTNLRRNYDVVGDRYQTQWSEIDVSCEACHGPGERHVARIRAGSPPSPGGDFAHALARRGHWTMNPETGIAENPEANGRAQVEACARCHSRRVPLADGYRHDLPWTDSYRPQVLQDDLYFADGQILEEVFVYGSFVQSRMAAKGVACSDCHDPHTLEPKRKGNALCGQCHLASRYDVTEHHFHAPGEAGSACVDCHMPARVYMVNDARRDHGFRVPRPDLADETGAPDACTGCHAGRTPAWAAEQIARAHAPWTPRPHFGPAIASARAGAIDAAAALRAIADDGDQPGIVRATAASLLGAYPGPESVRSLAVLLRSPDPLVRVNAVEALEGVDPRTTAPLLAPLLEDPSRMVRMASARLLAGVDANVVGVEHGAALARGLQEFIASQQANADRAESLVNLGNLYAVLGDAERARFHFEDAITLNPGFGPAYANLADLHRALGAEAETDRVLREGIRRLGDEAALHHALGLSLVRQGRMVAARESLQRAVTLAPDEPRYRYVLAIALEADGRVDEAIAELQRAYASRPANPSVLVALVQFHQRSGDIGQARRFADDLARLQPWNPRARALSERLAR